MTYDLMNRQVLEANKEVITNQTNLLARRDTQTNHHTSVTGSLTTIDKYLELGFDAQKLNLGFAFYAKWFGITGQCTGPIGCTTVELEDANGADTGKSGATTFAEQPDIVNQGQADETQGGQWLVDGGNFTTWDTPEFIQQKFEKIVKARQLGGVSKLLLLLPNSNP